MLRVLLERDGLEAAELLVRADEAQLVQPVEDRLRGLELAVDLLAAGALLRSVLDALVLLAVHEAVGDAREAEVLVAVRAALRLPQDLLADLAEVVVLVGELLDEGEQLLAVNEVLEVEALRPLRLVLLRLRHEPPHVVVLRLLLTQQ